MLKQAPFSRRSLLRLGGSIASINALSPWIAHASAKETVTGVVFDDRSGTGIRQPSDPGIPGVLVSNGIDVVKTDENGRYRLPIDDGATVFVIKPKGWSVPLDADTRLPRHFYTHRPFGTSAALRYPGLDATGVLPESVDFPLQRATESSRFSVLMLADPQPSDRKELDYLRQMIVAEIDDGHAFTLTLGDLMSDDLSLYEPYNKLIGQLSHAGLNLPGNHDLNQDAPHPALGRETWKRVFGPTHHALEYGDAVFILLDNVKTDGVSGTKYRYRGEIGSDQLAFVQNLLAHVPSDKLIILAMHIPLVSALDPRDASSNTSDTAALLKLLDTRPAVSFSGHMHTTEHHYLGAEHGCVSNVVHHHHVLTAASGSWWSGPFDPMGLPAAQSTDGTPNGYHVLDIDGTSYQTTFVPARDEGQMRLMLASGLTNVDAAKCRLTEGAVDVCNLGDTALLANVFDGGSRTRVTCQIDQRASLDMESAALSDPVTMNLYARAGSSLKPWVKAEVSSHIWQLKLPSDLPPGLHKATVSALDPFGRTHSHKLIFEVKA